MCQREIDSLIVCVWLTHMTDLPHSPQIHLTLQHRGLRHSLEHQRLRQRLVPRPRPRPPAGIQVWMAVEQRMWRGGTFFKRSIPFTTVIETACSPTSSNQTVGFSQIFKLSDDLQDISVLNVPQLPNLNDSILIALHGRKSAIFFKSSRLHKCSLIHL